MVLYKSLVRPHLEYYCSPNWNRISLKILSYQKMFRDEPLRWYRALSVENMMND